MLHAELEAKTKSAIRRKLLRWFDTNQRDLPWRKSKTPYRVWISEIMLQQTQVATVIDYYRRFLKRFPNVKKLAAANESEVLKLWEGLGYYRRARQLHAAAQVIVDQHQGKFPTDFEQVLALPGVGRYTAGAILSISQDQKLPILEGNTIRLFARLMLMDDDTTSTVNQKSLWAYSESLLPRKRAGDFNQALMELGSEICKPRNPLCSDCPIKMHCPTRAENRQREIPKPKKPPKYEDIQEAVLLVQRNERILIRLCLPDERWAGLWDFPRFGMTSLNSKKQLADELKKATGLSTRLTDQDITIKHAVTRFRITLNCYSADKIQGRLKSGTTFEWVELTKLAELPLSITGRKIATRLTKLSKSLS
jgi:A/G-specific adenine glycosylase